MMAETATVNIRLDKALKESAEATLSGIGIDMTTALTVFLKTVVRQNRIPFDVVGDRFYEESNQAHLRAVLADARAGRGLVVKTMDELEEMARD
jgi:DNA-damage-inducible protein J